MTALNEPKFDIDSINIIAFTSFEGNETKNLELQKKRSESIVKAIENIQNRAVPYSIQLNDGWELLLKDIPEEYKNIVKSKNEAKNALKNTKTKNNLEPILKNHRYAQVKMNVTYDVSENYAPDFMVSKFNKCMAKNDYPTAFAIQKYLIKCVEDGNCSEMSIQKMNISEDTKNLPFLTNKYYMLSVLGALTDEDIQKMTDLSKMDNTNIISEFNAFCCQVENMDITSIGQISTTQSKIDRYYNNAIGKQYADKVDALNITLQYKILDFLNNAETPDETLIESTYEKIKSIALPTIKDWEKAYQYAMEKIDQEAHQSAEGLYHNLNTLQSRSGSQLPFTSVNLGSCTLPEGRLLIKAMLDESIKGGGKLHSTYIFPCVIFQLGKGINKKAAIAERTGKHRYLQAGAFSDTISAGRCFEKTVFCMRRRVK